VKTYFSDRIPVFVFVAGVLASLWCVVEASRIFDVLSLFLIGFAVGAAIAIPIGFALCRKIEKHRGIATFFTSLGIVGVVVSVVLLTNNYYPKAGPILDALPIINKETMRGKNGLTFTFLVGYDGKEKTIDVRHSVWRQLQVGDYYRVQVWTGLWGYRFIAMAGDR
jgi:hypothetical protein